ncbi:MAG: prolyl oligopeptidase family serine peptidase [Pseudomonadales bacterium]|nr:prolyl oligopeptidase family serine peptidase [Pseudomonadales bacterium]
MGRLVWIFLLLPSLLTAQDLFTNLDVFEMEIAGDPQISPDGSQIAYVRRTNDIMIDNARSNIWLINSDGSDHRPLLSGADSYSSPRWSPDGSRLVYVSSAEGRGPELYVRWMDTGQTALVSNLSESPSSIAWSPDGSHLAFSQLVKTEASSLVTPPATPEGAEWAPGVTYIDRLSYRADGRGYLDSGYSHVFVIPAEGGTPRQISAGDFNHGGRISWAPDGSHLVISAYRNEDWEYAQRNTDLWSVFVEDGAMHQLTDRDGPDGSPTHSPDGSRIAYLGYDDEKMGYHNSKVYILDTESNETTELTGDLDRSIDAVAWAGSSNRLLVSYDDFGKKQTAELTMEGDLQVITDDLSGVGISRPYTSGGFSVANNGDFTYTKGSAHRPSDVAISSNGSSTQLTELNEDILGHRNLGEVRDIRWRSSVGDHDVHGWLVLPPDFDPAEQYPLILEIHGGPFTAYGPHFSVEVQLYAAAGYVVLYTNPRGSTSYGYEFANEIHHSYPGEDYFDLISGVDAVIDMGFIDEEQLFVTGGSGGGVLSSWIVGNTDRFAAAVVAKPVINWASHALYSDIPEAVGVYWFESMPWEDYESYWQRSPLSLVGNVSTPTMLLTGEDDFRTPMAESEQYYQALKWRGIDTALVRVPEASHGIAARPSHQIAKVQNILAWFERYRDSD